MWKCKRLGLFARIVRAPCTCTLKCKNRENFDDFLGIQQKNSVKKQKHREIFLILSIGIQFDNFLGYKKITKNRESLFTSFIGIQFDDFWNVKKITKSWKIREISRKPKNSRIIIFNLKRH